MTRLSYKIGNIYTASYAEAVEVAKQTKDEIEKIYTTITEPLKVDPEKVKARAWAVRVKAQEEAEQA